MARERCWRKRSRREDGAAAVALAYSNLPLIRATNLLCRESGQNRSGL